MTKFTVMECIKYQFHFVKYMFLKLFLINILFIYIYIQYFMAVIHDHLFFFRIATEKRALWEWDFIIRRDNVITPRWWAFQIINSNISAIFISGILATIFPQSIGSNINSIMCDEIGLSCSQFYIATGKETQYKILHPRVDQILCQVFEKNYCS